MRILLDTNIFIHREDDHVLPEDFQRLLKILNQIKVDLLLHPLSIEEISKDKNKERKEILLSKIKSYRTLEAPPDPEGDYNYLKIVGSRDKINDQIDNAILYAIHRNAVAFLITEDRGIHKKASRLEVDNRVLLIDDALQLFEGYIYKERIISPPALKDEFVYNLDIKDPIFDSLKKDYKEFEDWFEKISKEGRKCWVYYRNGGSIGAILIYKFEEEPIDAKPSLSKKRRLKLSTFKVTYVGNKIGELYIKSAIDISIRNDISEIYLTQFTKPEDRLVGLISEYGFYKAAVNRRGEDIFVKNLIVREGTAEDLSPREIAKKFYPSFYDGKRVKKFIVPVRPEYHSRLFTDFRKRQTTIYEHSGEFIVEGNTIKKAYLTHSKAKRMSEGDILFFYRSRDWRSITSLGVVEAVYKETRDANQILQLVGKRTVYSKDEIAEMVKKSVIVILFKHHFHFKHSLHLNKLKEEGILRGAPQSITEIGHESYVKIKGEGDIDERFTFN